MKFVIKEKLIDLNDIKKNPKRLFYTLEQATYIDFSLATKLLMNFVLFGGSLKYLAKKDTKKKFVPLINEGKVVGCFVLSELGFGNNS